MQLTKKDVLSVRVTLSSDGQTHNRDVILTAADEKEILDKLGEWLHFLRVRSKSTIAGYEILYRIASENKGNKNTGKGESHDKHTDNQRR